MATAAVTVTLDLTPLRKYEAQIRRGSPAYRKTLQQWGDMHREWLRQRYIRLSAGGGTWPPLAPATIRKKGFATILIETRELFERLIFRRINVSKKQVSIGYHTGIHGDRDKSIKEIVGYHQEGTPNMPKRPILVGPSPAQKKKMVAVAEKLLGAEAKKMNPPINP